MTAYLYPISLAACSLLVFGLERLFPWRPQQRQWRPKLWSDALHLVFNGHFLGILLAGLADRWLLPHVDRFLSSHGLMDTVYRNAAAPWPLWLQIIVALVVVDFMQWCVHNLLHRVPALWELHKAHHSVQDGEMDWIVSFRFSWLEVMVYKSILYLPLVFFGFRAEALLFHAIFGTLIGHLNHANLNLGHGPWRYVLNSPRMHLWHHDIEGDAKTTVNFGIIFSTWDWLFGTAKMPADPPAHIGFKGVERFPADFFGQEVWPLQRALPRLHSKLGWSLIGALTLAAAWFVQAPGTLGGRGAQGAESTPMQGEPSAASQPSGVTPPADAYSGSPAEAESALAHFGASARAAGYAHPEAMVSVPELARALGAPSLVVIDVRPRARFAVGHIPGARVMGRGDYSFKEPVPGLSLGAEALGAALRARGVGPSSVVVLYGDGGPEPYRLWWTLRTMAGHTTRLLDGGLAAWKGAGHRVAGGEGLPAPSGTLQLTAAPAPVQRWPDLQSFLAQPAAMLVDTRSDIEFSGRDQHPKAARAGHIPGAHHLPWDTVLRNPPEDPRLRPPAELDALLARAGVTRATPVVTYCQSGTRSSALFYALHQLGHPPDKLLNYDGSWAEYSRLSLPVATR